jgi:polysaccharide chain length determinant protein (PEP-CTERM system associated)
VEVNELFGRLIDEVRGAWRFKWVALAVTAGLCVAGWTYVLLMPNVYEGRARVYVDTQGALRPLLQGLAIAPNVESDVALVRQAMLSRPHLEKVAHKTGLDLKATNAREQEALLNGLAEAIVITSTPKVSNSPTDGVYSITFKHNSRDKALAVVQSLLNTFVEDTLGIKRSGQEEAQQFLRDQISEYEKRLAESEQRLVEFKRENVGKMPDQRGDYFSRLQLETTALETARNELALAESRRAALQRQVDGEDPFVFGLDSPIAAPAAVGEKGDLTARIAQLEGRVEELLLRFTEKHPEVLGARKQIEDLKRQQQAELARLKQGQGTGSMSQSVKSNPVYQSLKLELNRADVQVAELRSVVAQRASAVAALRNVANTVPQVEADVARLTRDYEVTKSQYLALVQRLETAKLSEDADATGTVKFDVIDPPVVGLRPVAPKRPLLLTGVLFLAVGVGAGVAYLLNLIRPVFLNAKSLSDAFDLPVIGTVGRDRALEHALLQRRDTLRFAGAFGVLLAAFVVVNVLSERVFALLLGSQA